MIQWYEVEWTYTNSLGYWYTEHKSFETVEKQHAFALEKCNEPYTCEVRTITTEIWKES